MNSSSVPAWAVKPSSRARASCARRIWRGLSTTGEWSAGHIRSHCTIAVAGRWVSSRSVLQSGTNSMSP